MRDDERWLIDGMREYVFILVSVCTNIIVRPVTYHHSYVCVHDEVMELRYYASM